jgi:3-hydroxybutyryl-CoA dehydrogenase
MAEQMIETVGIVGAGTMGSGIATALAAHGRSVLLFDQSPAQVAAAIDAAGSFLARQVEKGRMTEHEGRAARDRLRPAAGLADLGPCDLVIEAVFEDFALKARLFETLSRLLRPETLIATNTSCLRVDDLATHVTGPERFSGLHFFSPAAVNPVVEVVSGKASDPALVDRAEALCRAIGKRPIRCRDSHGFAINRFFCPYTNEAVRLLDEGLADTATIDRAAEAAFGVAIGPFAVQNIIKPRINLHAIQNLAPLGAFYAPAAGLVAQGATDLPWPIEGEPPPAQAVSPQLVDRLRAAVFIAVLELLDEAVAAPADIDDGARLALRFTRPPCALMDELAAARVAALVQPLRARHGRPTPDALERVGTLVA